MNSVPIDGKPPSSFTDGMSTSSSTIYAATEMIPEHSALSESQLKSCQVSFSFLLLLNLFEGDRSLPLHQQLVNRTERLLIEAEVPESKRDSFMQWLGQFMVRLASSARPDELEAPLAAFNGSLFQCLGGYGKKDKRLVVESMALGELLKHATPILNVNLNTLLEKTQAHWQPIRDWLASLGYLGQSQIWQSLQLSHALESEAGQRLLMFGINPSNCGVALEHQIPLQLTTHGKIPVDEFLLIHQGIQKLKGGKECTLSMWQPLLDGKKERLRAQLAELKWFAREAREVANTIVKDYPSIRKEIDAAIRRSKKARRGKLENLKVTIGRWSIALRALRIRLDQLKLLQRAFDLDRAYLWSAEQFASQLDACVNDVGRIIKMNTEMSAALHKLGDSHFDASPLFSEFAESAKTVSPGLREIVKASRSETAQVIESLLSEPDTHERRARKRPKHSTTVTKKAVPKISPIVRESAPKPVERTIATSQDLVVSKARPARSLALAFEHDRIQGVLSSPFVDPVSDLVDTHHSLLEQIPKEWSLDARRFMEEVGDHLFLAGQSLELMLEALKSQDRSKLALALQTSYLDIAVALEQYLGLHYLKKHGQLMEQHDLRVVGAGLSIRDPLIRGLCDRYRLAMFWSRFFCRSLRVSKNYDINADRLEDLDWIWKWSQGSVSHDPSKLISIVCNSIADFGLLIESITSKKQHFAQGWVEGLHRVLTEWIDSQVFEAHEQCLHNEDLKYVHDTVLKAQKKLPRHRAPIIHDNLSEIAHLSCMMDVGMRLAITESTPTREFWMLRARLMVDKIAEPLYQTIIAVNGVENLGGHVIGHYHDVLTGLKLHTEEARSSLRNVNLGGWHHYARRPETRPKHALYLHHLEKSLAAAGNPARYVFHPEFSFEDEITVSLPELSKLADYVTRAL